MIEKANVIYGCMGLGGEQYEFSKETKKQAFRALDAAIESGIRRFDHANIYNNGNAEAIFGLWLKENKDLREELNIQSKAGIKLHLGPHNSSYYDFSSAYILDEVQRSLERLNVDYLDMFLFHRPDPLASPEMVAETMNGLLQKRLVRSIGVSNMSVAQIEWLRTTAGVNVVANQIQFGLGHALLVEQDVLVNTNTVSNNGLQGMLQYAMTNNIELQAYSPLNKGLYLRALMGGDSEDVVNTKALLHELSITYNSNPMAILLSWITQLPAQMIPVIGTTNPDRIAGVKSISEFELSHDDWYRLWVTSRGEKLP